MSESSQDVAVEPVNPAESGTYEDQFRKAGRNGSRLKIGLVAAASALAGGLAAAWYYRRTVSLLRNPPEGSDPSNFGIIEDDGEDYDPHI